METKPLNGKVAIVTGSGTGIGRVIAKTLAENGAAVMLSGRREAPLQAVQAEIQAAGGTAAYMRTDVGELDQCVALVKGTVESSDGSTFWSITRRPKGAPTKSAPRACRTCRWSTGSSLLR